MNMFNVAALFVLLWCVLTETYPSSPLGLYLSGQVLQFYMPLFGVRICSRFGGNGTIATTVAGVLFTVIFVTAVYLKHHLLQGNRNDKDSSEQNPCDGVVGSQK